MLSRVNNLNLNFIFNFCHKGGGADFSVNLNTGSPHDCSDSGADPSEAVSWGKIKIGAKAVKVVADSTITFPLLVYQTFVSHRVKMRLKRE